MLNFFIVSMGVLLIGTGITFIVFRYFLFMVYDELNNNGQPLVPTNRHGKVKHLLKTGKAKGVKRCPFTIKLQYDTKKSYSAINPCGKYRQRNHRHCRKQRQWRCHLYVGGYGQKRHYSNLPRNSRLPVRSVLLPVAEVSTGDPHPTP